jgi:hypothetical protein
MEINLKLHDDIKSAHEALPPDWYGEVIVTYQAGQPVTIKMTSVKKLNTTAQRSTGPNEYCNR